MDAKEQELIEARDEADRKWDEASLEMTETYRKRCEEDREMAEASRKWDEADRELVEADRKLWKYRKSKAQPGGKAVE